MNKLYIFLDHFFLIFHTILILFNLSGWIWKKTRKLNLIILFLTGASWTVLGIFYGFGYCPLTDWHFEILEKLGNYNLPMSYIKYFIDRITGIEISEKTADLATLIVYIIALFISLFMNFRKNLIRLFR